MSQSHDDFAEQFERRLLGGRRRYDRDEAAGSAGMTISEARRYWRAMGFADVGDETVAFTDADLEALRRMSGLVDDGVIDEELAVSLTRALGHTMSRLVEWQVQAFVEYLVEQRRLEPEKASREALALADEHLEDLERLVVYSWRRQLAALTGRSLAHDSSTQRGFLTVGFADLVSYSRLSQRLEERELARLVSRFESLANDIVASDHGRLVKTVGDEVLFVADRPDQAARIALGLAETMAQDPVLPDVRVGLATGTVVSRQGDVFGRTVNLASRLTALAPPGAVLVDSPTSAALASTPGIVVDRQAVRAVRGLGLVEPGVLRRVPAPDSGGTSNPASRPGAGDAGSGTPRGDGLPGIEPAV